MSECNEPIYPRPPVTELPKSDSLKGNLTQNPDLTNKTISVSEMIEKTEISDKENTIYKIDVLYKKAKPKKTIIKAKIL